MKQISDTHSSDINSKRLLAVILTAIITGCASSPGGEVQGSSVAPAPTVESQNMPPAMTSANLEQPAVLRQTIAPALYELAYSARQNAVFVASAGGTGDNARLTRILRLDPQTLALQTEIPLKEQGFGMTLDDEADRLYVTNALDAAITVINTQTNQIVDVIRVAEKVSMAGFDGEMIERPPHNLRELVLDKANHRLFAPGLWINDSALYVIDTNTLKLEKVIPGFGYGASGVTLDEAEGKVYVSNLQGQLFRIDARTLDIENKFEVSADQLLNLVFDKQHKRILAVDQGGGHVDVVREKVAKIPYSKRGEGNRVVVINPSTGEVEKSIPTNKGPVALLIDEQRNRLYVTNRIAGTISVYNTNDYRLLQALELPIHPNSLALNKQTGVIFSTIKNEHQASITSGESVVRVEY